MLCANTVQIIKSTVPLLQTHANAITECFYPLLFSQYPEVVPYFNQTNQRRGTQAKALANAVVAYGANIDELGNLSEAVTKIVQKHTSLGVLPEQYDAVGGCLLQAIKEVLGDVATSDVIEAWGKAYTQLADILIAAEEEVYTLNAQKEGGWRGLREFNLVRKEPESSVITSFYFEPSDNKGVPDFEAGQFLTIVFDDVNGSSVRRNYSLSDAPGKGYLRISVKRELDGEVSSYLHDSLAVGGTVSLLPPCGGFTLLDSQKPLVLLTAGVGITPAISMLNVAASSGRDIHFIHAATNSRTHAFKTHVGQLSERHPNVRPFYIYSQPEAECKAQATGYITQALIEKQLCGDNDVEFYFLGPKPFMIAAYKIAQDLGVPNSQIHYEFFGPDEGLSS